jgi:hypothetical protein
MRKVNYESLLEFKIVVVFSKIEVGYSKSYKTFNPPLTLEIPSFNK